MWWRAVLAGAMAVMLFAVSCGGAVTKEEYVALKRELEQTKAELEATRAELEAYKAKLAKAHAYAEFLDVNYDAYRFKLGRITKYGYVGTGAPEYIKSVLAKAEATGDTRLKEMVTRGLNLPWGEEKDKAWAETWLYFVDRLLEATKP